MISCFKIFQETLSEYNSKGRGFTDPAMPLFHLTKIHGIRPNPLQAKLAI